MKTYFYKDYRKYHKETGLGFEEYYRDYLTQWSGDQPPSFNTIEIEDGIKVHGGLDYLGFSLSYNQDESDLIKLKLLFVYPEIHEELKLDGSFNKEEAEKMMREPERHLPAFLLPAFCWPATPSMDMKRKRAAASWSASSL